MKTTPQRLELLLSRIQLCCTFVHPCIRMCALNKFAICWGPFVDLNNFHCIFSICLNCYYLFNIARVGIRHPHRWWWCPVLISQDEYLMCTRFFCRTMIDNSTWSTSLFSAIQYSDMFDFQQMKINRNQQWSDTLGAGTADWTRYRCVCVIHEAFVIHLSSYLWYGALFHLNWSCASYKSSFSEMYSIFFSIEIA